MDEDCEFHTPDAKDKENERRFIAGHIQAGKAWKLAKAWNSNGSKRENVAAIAATTKAKSTLAKGYVAAFVVIVFFNDTALRK